MYKDVLTNTSLYINRWIHVQKLYSLNHNKIVIDIF